MSDDFEPDDFVKDMQERQAARRADPLAFLQTALAELWEGGREEEMLTRWRSRAHTDPWFAADVLHAIDVVLESPPVDLAERLKRADAKTQADVLAWVAEQGAKLRAISQHID